MVAPCVKRRRAREAAEAAAAAEQTQHESAPVPEPAVVAVPRQPKKKEPVRERFGRKESKKGKVKEL